MSVLALHFEGTPVDEKEFVKFQFDVAVKVTRVNISADTCPSGADVTLDICKDGVEQSTILTLADGDTEGGNELSSELSFDTSEYFSLKFKSMGATPGESYTFVIHYTTSVGATGSSGRTLLQMREFVIQWLVKVSKETVDTKLQAAIDRVINHQQEKIVVAIPKALRKTARLRTEDSYSTGTLTAAKGLTGITVDGGVWSSGYDGWYIIINSQSIPYIFTHDAGDDADIDMGYVEDSDSGLSYEIIKAEHSLASDCAKLIGKRIRCLSDEADVEIEDLDYFRREVISPYSTGTPIRAVRLPNGKLLMYPLSVAAEIYEYDYEALITELVLDGDVPTLRKDLHYLMELGAKADAKEYNIRDISVSEIARAKREFESELAKKRAEYDDAEVESSFMPEGLVE